MNIYTAAITNPIISAAPIAITECVILIEPSDVVVNIVSNIFITPLIYFLYFIDFLVFFTFLK